jgi:ComF family protein
MWMMYALAQNILSILFPPACYGCNKPGPTLCTACLKKAQKTVTVLQPYITTLYSYQDPLIKKSIHAIKYFHRRDLLLPLATTLVDYIRMENIVFTENTVLVPIPMPLIRKYIRGYNQSEHIARILSQQLQVPVDMGILKRLRSPKRQVTLKTKSERIKNQRQSFVVNKTVSLLDIILIDDVTTTGATLQEARDLLLSLGAKSVRAITLAH